MPVESGCIWVSREAESAGRPETHPLTSTMTEGHTHTHTGNQHTAAQGGSDHVCLDQPWLEQRHPRYNLHRTPPPHFSSHGVACGWRCTDEKARGVPYNHRGGRAAHLCPASNGQLTRVSSYLNHPALRHHTVSIRGAPAG